MKSINDVYGCNPCHAKKGGEHGKFKGNTLETNDYL